VRLLTEIGYAVALLARELPEGKLMLIDGHLRTQTTPNAMIPVLMLDVTEDEADKILLTYDPVSAMAQADKAAMEMLLATVKTESKTVAVWAYQHGVQLTLSGVAGQPRTATSSRSTAGCATSV
jgi:hypothetical protein